MTSTDIDTLKKKQVAEKQPKDFPAMLKDFLPEIQRALPKHLNGDRMSRIALTTFRRTPMLAQCDPRSVFAAVIQASQLGLEPDTLGRSYLIPYKNHSTNKYECQFIPGWKGLVELLNRSGQGAAWTGAAFEGDEFDYMGGDSPFVKHRPGGEYDPDKLTHVYAVGRPKGSDWPIIEVWPIARVIKHRDRYNKVGQRHYSYKNLEMYARKVVLLQVLKYMPASPELATAMEMDTAAEVGVQGLTVKDSIHGTWAPPPDDESIIEGETEETTTTDKGQTWPKSDGNGQWVDSDGVVYNSDLHAWSEQQGHPAVKADGTFRARRGMARKQPEAKKADDTKGPLDTVLSQIYKAQSVDELDIIVDACRGRFTGDDAEKVGQAYQNRVSDIQGNSAGGDPGYSME